MGMFGGKESKEDKDQRKVQEVLDRYGLESVSPKDLESIKKIMGDLFANNLLKAGLALSMAPATDQLTVTYLSALVEQNWIMIRQLDSISKKLEK